MGENSFFDLIPDDLEEGILLKIQCEKSILRCTSVCKSWCYLIKSSQFINTHLSRPDKTKYLFCKSVDATCNSNSVMEFSLYSDSAPSDKYCTSVFPCIPAGVRIRGSCSGVICYSLYPDCRGDIFLWNPTIRKLKTLPRSPARRHISRAIGFWFDKDKNDHLIVKIAYTNASQMSSVCPGAREDSILDVNLDYDKGTLRWLALHEQSGRIVTLDMNTGEFRQTLISVCCFPAKRLLCLKGVDANSFDYVRHDAGCPHYRPQDNILWHVGFRNNGEALFYSKHNSVLQHKSELVSYNFGARQMKSLGFDHTLVFSAHPFVKSLLLLNDSDATMTCAGMVVGRTREKRVGLLKSLVGKAIECKSCSKVDL